METTCSQRIRFALSVITAFLLLGFPSLSFSWQTQTLDSTGNVGEYCSVALDSNNKPRISYHDATNGNLKYYNGSTAAIVTLGVSGFTTGRYTDIAVDTNDDVHISHSAAAPTHGFYYSTNFFGSGMSGQTGFSSWTGATYSSIISGTSGSVHVPFIAYYQPMGTRLLVWDGTKYDGQSGASIYVDGGVTNVGQYPSIAKHSFLNHWHISYYDVTNGDLKYANSFGGSYINIVDFLGNVGSYSSIAFKSGVTHISYYDVTNGNLKYFNSGVSGAATVVDSAGDVGRFTSIAVDSSNKVHISYYDVTNGNLKYALYDGGSWSTTTVDSTGDVGQFSSLAVDSTGKVHIAYYDASNQDLKYATSDPNRPPNTPTAISPGNEVSLGAVSGVTLIANGFSDPDPGDSCTGVHWLIRRADSVYLKAGYPASFIHIYTSGSTVQNTHAISGLIPGMKYVWKVGYVDSGSGTTSWSTEYAFKAGTSEADSNVSIPAGTGVANFKMSSFFQWADDPVSTSVFGDEMGGSYNRDNFRFGCYDPTLGEGQYIECGDNMKVTPGRAMWCLAKNGLPITVNGIPVSKATDIEVGLLYNAGTGNGWNQIGCPNNADYYWGNVQVVEYNATGAIVFGPTDISSLPEPNAYIEKRLWSWSNGAYDSSTTWMRKYQGYWVKAKKPNVYLKFSVGAQARVTNPKTMFAGLLYDAKRWIARKVISPSSAIADSGSSPPNPPGDFAVSAGGGLPSGSEGGGWGGGSYPGSARVAGGGGGGCFISKLLD